MSGTEPQVFISHAEEDHAVAIAVADALEQARFSTWYFERDSVPGPKYLDQVHQAVTQCEAFLLVVSQDSIGSHQVDAEVVLAFETRKPFVPVLGGITHHEFRERKPAWRLAVGAATSIAIPPAGIEAILDRIVAGARALGLRSAPAQEQMPASDPPVISPAPSNGNEVECSLFAPPQIAPGATVLVHAWLHTSAQSEEIARSSAEFDGSVQLRGRMAVPVGLRRGAQLRLGLEVGGMPVRSLSTVLTWQGGPDALLFRVGPPEVDLRAGTMQADVQTGRSQPLTEVGQLTLFRDSVLAGMVKFKLQTAGGPAPAGPTRKRKAFLCYALRDRAEVLRRAQVLSLVGMESFADLTSLSPTENWEHQIKRAIDDADVFVLFWSEAARHSEWVEREWQYAVRTKGLEFIIPVAIETPMPPPPPELAHLHFSPSLAYVG